jgi:AAA+ superfamily predicted ATPase
MPADKSVIAALAAAVQADPDAVPVRLHLAGLLLEAGDAPAALEHFAFVLARNPAHQEALQGAAAAAAAGGQAERAAGYTRLLTALRGTPPPPAESSDPDSAEARSSTGNDNSLPLRGEGGVGDQGTEQPGEDRPRLRVIDAADRFAPDAEEERPQVTLADVGGMEEVKRRLNAAFLGPLRNPKLRKMYGKSLRGGLLLYGPPGCGKTFIARATAGELGARFVSVGLADVLDMWLGESERKLHEIFQTARRNTPTVLFFDEIDALGHKRSQMRGHGGRNVVNVLLSELDGVSADNEGVFVLGATNHPWDVDTALRRPGRFDRMLLVLPPDEKARQAILRFHLQERPAEAVDVGWVAARTGDFSGADLAHLCESAAEVALMESVESGTARPLATADFKRALQEVRPSVRAWFDTARNYAMFANEGGMYDELLAYIKAKNF